MSTTLARTYGFEPSLIVPITPMLIYQAINQHPAVVPGVAKIQAISHADAYPRHFFDRFA